MFEPFQHAEQLPDRPIPCQDKYARGVYFLKAWCKLSQPNAGLRASRAAFHPARRADLSRYVENKPHTKFEMSNL